MRLQRNATICILNLIASCSLKFHKTVGANGESSDQMHKLRLIFTVSLSMKVFLLINVKMSTIMSRKNSMLGLSKPEKKLFLYIYINEHLKYHAQLS